MQSTTSAVNFNKRAAVVAFEVARTSLQKLTKVTIVFAATVWLLGNWWTANLIDVGLALMAGVSIWDLVSPAHRRCGPDG